jgi:hypothetical protein
MYKVAAMQNWSAPATATAMALELSETVMETILSAASFVPHGYCLLWRPWLVTLYLSGDLLIAAS